MIYSIIEKINEDFEKGLKEIRKQILSLYIPDLLTVLNLIIILKEKEFHD